MAEHPPAGHRPAPSIVCAGLDESGSLSNALVQLADFVAGSVYNWHKEGNPMVRLIEGKLRANLTEDGGRLKRGGWRNKKC